ncbi:kinase-like domain-containing protein [Scheffersomyces amazonensis]|uniref:kinase-like domain-containing protein n=1 Tax=Scheffersomyces amazonensis TaxID=1078765 RepID=UPI00315D7C29
MSLVRKRKRFITTNEYIAKLYNVLPGGKNINIPKKPLILIGRSSACEVRILGSDVSSRHCQMTIIPSNAANTREYLHMEDLSTNGVYVNEEKLTKGDKVILRSGDKLRFAKTGGSYIFRYSSDILSEKSTETSLNKVIHKRTFFDDYILGIQLGSGHYAVVKEAKQRSTGEIVAVKIFHPNKSGNKNSTNEQAKLEQEMNLLLSINHPNIVKFISHYIEPINEYAVTTYLVLEKMNSGELFQRIVNKSKLRPNETKAFFKQLLSGLKYLHDNSIIHRDIKPENILLDITPRINLEDKQTGPWDEDELDIKVKIADFGLAKFIGELKFTNTLCGTPAYVAPEVLRNDRNYTTKVDVWSTGVLLYVCLCGFPPFSDELGPPSMRDQILQGKYAFYSPYWDNIVDDALDLITNLLVTDSQERYDVNQTLEHVWFQTEDIENSPVEEQEQEQQENDESMTISRAGTRNESLISFISRSNTQPLTLRDRFYSNLEERTSVL